MTRKRRSLENAPSSEENSKEENIYFEETSLEYFPSGCTVLDCALGGGWVKDRFINIYGQSGSGKTLLLIEATINFLKKYPDHHVRYVETEAAFDEEYAYKLGVPKERFSLETDIYTVEDLHDDAIAFSEKNPGGLYIIDSWDALSDKAELGRKIDENSMGAAKAKKLSETFRRMNSKMSKAGVTFMSVSQIRAKIGVTYGRKYDRAGGYAIQFYGSQIVVINEKEKIKKVIDKITRTIGIVSEIKVEKNRAGMPFRDCLVPIYFGYGIDNLEAGLMWLEENGADTVFDELGISKTGYGRYLTEWRRSGNPELEKKVDELVKREWNRIEQGFAIGRSKYS